MKCREFSNLLDAFAEDNLSEKELTAMQDHMAQCDACAAQYAMRQDLRQLDDAVTLPQSFSQAWRQRVREESEMEKTSGMKKKWQHWIAVAAALVFVLGGTLLTRDDLAAQSGTVPIQGKRSYAVEESYDYTASNTTMARGMMFGAAPTAAMDSAPIPEAGDTRTEKIIRNASFTVKTLSFDQDVAALQELALEMGGRVEYLSTSGDKENGEMRSGSLTLRIPAARLDEFLSGAQQIGRLTALQQEAQDVTDNYYDVQARLDTQRTKMERLQTLLAAAQDISDLIEIENSIADTQYMIDSYTAQLKNYDGKVDYSTVRVTIREIQVQEAEELSLGQRMLAGLQNTLHSAGDFFRDCAIFLVAVSPLLLCAGAVVIVLVIIRKRKLKKKEDKAE